MNSGTSRSITLDVRNPRNAIFSLISALLYGFVGVSMIFVNKATLHHWPFSNTFLTFQMATSVIILFTLRLLRVIEMRSPDLKSAKSLFWVVFLYNANVAFALAAVQALSIPVYNVMKRLTPVVILTLKFFVFGGEKPPIKILLSVLTVVSGCILAGLGDLSFDITGYSMAMVSCLLQATYLILVEKSGSEKGFNSNELLMYNAIMSLPVLIVLTYVSGELGKSLPALVKAIEGGFLWLFLAALIMGSTLNYALFFCTIWNSALTTTIVGNLRSLLGTFLGFFLLGGVKATFFMVFGVIINAAGGVWYTAIQYHLKRKNAVVGSTSR